MVSVITPVYNCEKYLKQCIDSVISQTYKHWELILIDDSSSDSSKEIIKDYSAKDVRIKKIFLDQNVGAGVARNFGIKESKGRFIAFLDSDDFWVEDKLEKQLAFMNQNNVDFSFSCFFQLDKSDKPERLVVPPLKINRKKLLFNNYIKTLTVVYDTKNIGKVYMPNYRKRQDWGLWFNLLDKVENAYCYPEALAYYRTSNASLSRNKFSLLRENYNFYIKFLKYNYFSACVLMSIFLIVHFTYKRTSNKKIG